MEPIINSSLPEFKVQAFHNGSFKTVSSDDVKGKWAIFFFYPADFTFARPSWSISPRSTSSFRRWALRFIP